MRTRTGGTATARPLAVRHGRARRRARALLATLVALVGVIGLAGVDPPAHADDGDLVVEIATVAPAVLRTGDELTISGRIENTSDDEIPAPAVRLVMQRHVPASTDALAQWLDGTSTLNVTTLSLTTLEDPVAAGASVPFTVTIPTDGTFDQFSAWGPRGIAIQVSSGGLADEARTALLWYPTDPPLEEPTGLTVLLPLTPTAGEWADAVAQQVPVGEVAAPRLLEVLDAVGPRVTLAVDPALLETAAPGHAPDLATSADEPPSTDPTGTEAATDPTGETADPGDGEEAPPAPTRAALVDAIVAAAGRTGVVALGYADADVTALTAASGERLWRDGVEHGADLLEDAGLTVTDVVWPPGRVTTDALGTLVGEGADAVVLDAADVTSAVTTGARASVSTARGPLDVLLADAQLGTMLVATAGTGDTDRQEALALSAVLARAIPQGSGGLLAALPRDIGTGDLAGLADRVAALLDAPWLQPTDVAGLLERTTPSGLSLEVPDAVENPTAISPAEVTGLLEDREVVAAYADAAGDRVTDVYTPLLLTPLSAALTPGLRGELLATTGSAVAALGDGIRVEAGSDVLLINDAGNVPVTITNDLPVEATVLVELAPAGTVLQVREVPEVVLAPQGSTTVRIPVTAVANGNVTVDVRVLPGAGGPDLAPPASFVINVRAEWENIGTGVVAGLLVVAFVIGLIRTIRRGGRRAAAE